MTVELGSYSPAFFKMKVNIVGDIDLNAMPPKDFSVFFHEYIHFIQDFTTVAGCQRIYVYGEFIKQCVKQITKGETNFKIPVTIPPLADNVTPNILLLEKTEGDFRVKERAILTSVDIMKETVERQKGGAIPVETVFVTTEDSDYYSIGSIAIKESMAYIIEQLCTSSYELSPDFPYNVARKTADFLLGKENINNIELLALCDVSLLTSNPGLTFYKFLLLIKDGKLKYKKPEDIYVFFYQKELYNYGLGLSLQLADSYAMISMLALKALNDYYSLDRLKDLNKWLSKIFALGLKLRMENPYFFLKMAQGKKDKNNEVLRFFAETIGSPLMENKQGQMYKLKLAGGEPPTEYLYVLEQIYYLFKKGYYSCELKPWCLKTPGEQESPADSRCDNAPWSRCHDRNLCPYALFWHHRGLSEYEPSAP